MKLSGLRVIDLSLFLPGPHLTMMMADHGAEVIKVEPPGEGEPNRHIGPREDGQSVYFRNTHRGKKSVVLNLKVPAARAALLSLCDRADVFVEAFRPGVAARLGFDAATLRARNPRLVYCSIAAFGQSGPDRDLPAHDLAIQARSGTVSVNLGNDDTPAMPGMPSADMASSLMALSAILMALYRRESTGRGDFIDLSMQDALMAWLPNVTGPVFAHKQPPVAKHERTWGGGAFYRIYATRDGRHVVLGGQEPKFVRNLLTELGRADLVALCEQGPGPHQAPVVDFLAGVFAKRTQQEWIEWFRGRDVCFAPVLDLREAFDGAHVRERGMLLTDSGGREHIGVPIRFEEEAGRPTLAAPALGEHTEEVLRAAGLDEAQIREVLSANR
jgi:crotonobetainyl-CoA:carnitine CoA-transferase CaiB-like acyl-CoA transferase